LGFGDRLPKSWTIKTKINKKLKLKETLKICLNESQRAQACKAATNVKNNNKLKNVRKWVQLPQM
jgi:hypothetical protein